MYWKEYGRFNSETAVFFAFPPVPQVKGEVNHMKSSQLTLNDSFVRRALVAVGLVTAVVLITLLTWQISTILLLLFLGILLSVFLTSISGWIRERTPLSHRMALAITLLLLAAAIGGGGWLAAPAWLSRANSWAATCNPR